jgi:HSP20 family molecular chaperone IbpA
MSTQTQLEKNGTSSAARPYYTRTVTPAVDVFENGEELLVVADVPGVPAEGIDLHIENDTLTLSAKRAHRQADSPALVREYEEVDFATAFRIPAGIDASAVTAETKNGTLVVKLPKAAAAKARKVAVRAG